MRTLNGKKIGYSKSKLGRKMKSKLDEEKAESKEMAKFEYDRNNWTSLKNQNRRDMWLDKERRF